MSLKSAKPAIAICSCGAKFTSCATVEAILHISTTTRGSHHWIYIYTGVYTAGELIKPPNQNPPAFQEYMRRKYPNEPH